MRIWKKAAILCLAAILLLALPACGSAKTDIPQSPAEKEEPAVPPAGSPEPLSGETEPAEKNGDVVILFTSDIHCGIDRGFGLAGLRQLRDALEAQGCVTILVDDGDAVQGEAIGTLSKGEAIIELMNAMDYDVAIPGNHEFDYGVDQFLHLAEMADFPYISCNFNREGTFLFDPYVILEAVGMKIAFVGVTTPTTVTTSTPAYFQNEEGKFIYDFLQDETGEAVYQAVQQAVDDARAEGADYVYVMGHMGMGAGSAPWTYADVIEHTNGIDVFLDGHSHDTEQVVMKNKDGGTVVRSACGTKMSCIGYSRISAEKGIVDTGIWKWPNSVTAGELFGFHNEISDLVDSVMADLNRQLGEAVARTAVELTINDPVAVDNSGNPIRMIRRAETNLGDLCADAFRTASGADVAVVNGGGIRTSLAQGDITYGDIISVFPYGNELCVIEVTGRQLLDALEWGARAVPEELGGFLQVSGMRYDIDVSVPSGCIADENNMLVEIRGEYRVKNVTVGDEPLDPEKTYTVAGTDYILLSQGDGLTAFDGAPLLQDRVKLDNQVLIDYIVETLGGVVGGEYADPCGQGRITILEE